MENTFFSENGESSHRILYTPSHFARTNLMHLQEIGVLQAQSLHTSQREQLASYLFFMVDSGSGTLEYGGTTYQLTPGDCIFIDCRMPYAHRTSEDLWHLRWIHFYGPSLSNIYAKYVERGGQPCFRPVDISGFEQLWTQLYTIASSSDYIRDMRINEGLNSLLTRLMEESWHPVTHKNATHKQNLSQIKDYLDQHYTEKISLDELADTFYINKFYLTRVFKEQFGITINNYLLQKRITHAKQLLRFTDKTVEDIGYECGMGAVHYFSRMFKKMEGMSPSEYKKRW